MSAWGFSSFENDNALDWAFELTQSDSPNVIRLTLERALHDNLVRYEVGFMDTNTVDTAIAAAEIIAALKSNTSEMLPEVIRTWIHQHDVSFGVDIVQIATQVTIRALQAEELRDIWADPTDYAMWRRVVEDVRIRLQM
jgi:hypothetical protein